MKYSIIVPAYNVSKYLSICIKSLIKQTYTNYEIIIVNDGSMDDTGKIAEMLKMKYQDKIYVIHQKNHGLGGARNTGIEAAHGEYLVFIDSDDFVKQDLLERANKYITENDLDILVYGYCAIKENDVVNDNKRDADEFYMINQESYLIKCGPSAWNKIYRRSIFTRGKIRYPEKLLYEDIATTPITALYAKRIGVINTSLYYYVQRSGSITSTPQVNRIFELHEGYDRVLNYFNEKGMFEKYYRELEFLAIIHALYFTDIRIYLTKYNVENLKKSEEYVKKRFPDYKKNSYIKNIKILECNDVNEGLLEMLLSAKFKNVKRKYFPLLMSKKIIKKIFRIIKSCK